MHHWAELRGRPARYRQPQGSDLGIVADAPSRWLPYLRNVPTPAPSEGDTDVLQPRVHQSSPGRARASPASGQTSSSGETGESRDRSGASSAQIPTSPGADRISHQDRLIDRRTVLLDPPQRGRLLLGVDPSANRGGSDGRAGRGCGELGGWCAGSGRRFDPDLPAATTRASPVPTIAADSGGPDVPPVPSIGTAASARAREWSQTER
jgi:hypothetical protein